MRGLARVGSHCVATMPNQRVHSGQSTVDDINPAIPRIWHIP